MSDTFVEDRMKLKNACITRSPVVYSPDSKYFFVCTGSKVKVQSASTGQTLRTLSGHLAHVSGVVVNPENSLQIYSFSVDGFLILWDYIDGVQLKTFETGCIISKLVISLTDHTKAFFLGHLPKTVSPTGKSVHQKRSIIYSMTIPKVSGQITTVVTHKKLTKWLLGFELSPKGDYIAGVTGKQLCIFNTHTTKLVIYNHVRRLTCVAIHPSKNYVATGDKNGAIKLWFLKGDTNDPSASTSNFSSISLQRPAATEMHWHSHPVAALTFTGDGEYLLSGGVEAVLVIWQLHTGNKNFLPRLGAPISSITVTPSDSFYNVSCGDNTVKLISSSSLQVVKVTRGLTIAGVSARDNFPLLEMHPRRSHLLVSGMPGQLQFYDVENDRHIDTLPVAPQMYMSKMNKGTKLSKTNVEHMAFSWDGSCLVTVDRCDNGVIGDEIKLKFWAYSPSLQRYILNTCSDSPHARRITSIAYHPRKHLIVTTSKDRRFKVWVRTKEVTSAANQKRKNQKHNNNDEEKEHGVWSCRSVGFYRDSIARSADFSHDGSLLAVAYGQAITLWDVETNTLKNSLCHVAPGQSVRIVKFVKNSPFIVASTETTLYVWNLLTCSVWWSAKLSVSHITVHSKKPLFAVALFVQPPENQGEGNADSKLKNKVTQKIIMFKPESPQPLVISTLKNDRVLNMVFLRKTNNNESEGEFPDIAVISEKKRELFVLHPQNNNGDANDGDDAMDVDAVSEETAGGARSFEHLLSVTASAATVKKPDHVVTKEGKLKSGQIFNGPAHVLPSVSAVFPAFMSLLLQPPSNVDEEMLNDSEKKEDKEKKTSNKSISRSNSDKSISEIAELQDVKDNTDYSFLTDLFASKLTIDEEISVVKKKTPQTPTNKKTQPKGKATKAPATVSASTVVPNGTPSKKTSRKVVSEKKASKTKTALPEHVTKETKNRRSPRAAKRSTASVDDLDAIPKMSFSKRVNGSDE